MSRKKNVFDFIQMGMRSARKIERQAAEKQRQQQNKDQEFNKAFSDKTYSVAKKVIENVEKVADIDYESFFNRVNQKIDEKLDANPHVKAQREERSKAFEKKVQEHKARFNIDDYQSDQQNYKDSIIEKTKKNIQKKKDEADKRSHIIKQGPKENKLESDIKKMDSDLLNLTKDLDNNIMSLDEDFKKIDEQMAKVIKMKPKSHEDSQKDTYDGISQHIEVDQADDANEQETSDVIVLPANLETSESEEASLIVEDVLDSTEEITESSVEDEIMIEAEVNVDTTDIANEEIIVDTLGDDPTEDESFVTEEVSSEIIIETEKVEDSSSDKVEDIIESEVLEDVEDQSVESPLVEDPQVPLDGIEHEAVDEVYVEDVHVIEEMPSEPETVVLPNVPVYESVEKETKEVQPPVQNETQKQVQKEPKEKKEPVKAEYTKQNTAKNKKYYKQQQREKFAKKVKVELEDNLIVKKQRSLSRLFRFSLAFKLSFVFVFLIILTVVSLSVAFYFGIDFVIELKELGKLEDIQFFKDVLLILLIIFDLVTILLCISFGTKTSRELVRPIDEMTMIVKQINAKAMDRRLNVKGMHDELKELAMTFNEMLDRIENSYETQNRFTSDASHELRTPIAVIQGYINMLDRWGKADGEILEESIEAIKSESDNMKRLTEKLLLLAKADKGILEMEFHDFSLKDLINEITRETAMIDSNHEISNTINDVDMIHADRESLKQAIRIFVDNSVKYTPENGKIQINSYFHKKKIYIEIADNGIGIGKEDLENIFSRFYRVDKSRTKDSGGHGLGLSIAKWIISQHKGEIEVKSELNKGTKVTLILSPMNE